MPRTSSGIKAELKSIIFDRAVVDLTPQLLEIKSWKPDLVINVGVGEAGKNAKLLESVVAEIGLITGQKASIRKAKKAISDYKKASGHPEGLVELMVLFCERGAGFCREFGVDDEAFMTALVRMFEQALKQVAALPEDQRGVLLDRLDQVSVVSDALGYGVADYMGAILAEYR